MAKFLETSKTSTKRQKDFLLALANLREDGLDPFLSRYYGFIFVDRAHARRQVFETVAGHGQFAGWITKPFLTEAQANRPPHLKRALWHILQSPQTGLRMAWGEPEPRIREWRIFQLRQHFWEYTCRDLRLDVEHMEIPARTWFDQAALYLLKNGHLAKVCENKDCNIQTFFFAAKGRQRFCSDICAAPAIKEAKLRWWNENRKGKSK